MATITVTNLTAAPLLIQDLYATIAASGTITAERNANDLSAMKSLQAAINVGDASVSIVYDADELGSGLVLDSGAPVSATAVESGLLTLRVVLAVGGGGAEDTIVYAIGDMPANYRVVDHKLFVSTLIALSTVTLESELGGTGTQYLTISGAATGEVTDTTLTSAPLVVQSATEGMIVRRTDNDMVGELYLMVRPEL